MFTLPHEKHSFFRPSVRPYRIGLLFSHKNGDFGAISITQRSCADPISKVESHISDRCSHCHTKSIRSFVRSFVCSFVRSLACSLAHSFTHSLTHSICSIHSIKQFGDVSYLCKEQQYRKVVGKDSANCTPKVIICFSFDKLSC